MAVAASGRVTTNPTMQLDFRCSPHLLRLSLLLSDCLSIALVKRSRFFVFRVWWLAVPIVCRLGWLFLVVLLGLLVV